MLVFKTVNTSINKFGHENIPWWTNQRKSHCVHVNQGFTKNDKERKRKW